MAVSYQDWRGRVVEVTDETLAAVLEALDDERRPAPTAGGAVAAGAVAPSPRGRSWGFAVQLYSVRSRGSWGHGDLRDRLREAANEGQPAQRRHPGNAERDTNEQPPVEEKSRIE